MSTERALGVVFDQTREYDGVGVLVGLIEDSHAARYSDLTVEQCCNAVIDDLVTGCGDTIREPVGPIHWAGTETAARCKNFEDGFRRELANREFARISMSLIAAGAAERQLGPFFAGYRRLEDFNAPRYRAAAGRMGIRFKAKVTTLAHGWLTGHTLLRELLRIAYPGTVEYAEDLAGQPRRSSGRNSFACGSGATGKRQVRFPPKGRAFSRKRRCLSACRGGPPASAGGRPLPW